MLQEWKNRVAALRQNTHALYLASRDDRVPWAAKLIIVLVVAYALSPIDLIPDFIPVLGYLDDLILLPLGIAIAIKLIPREVWDECKERARSQLASELPRKNAAAVVITIIWIIVLGAAGLWIWRSLNDVRLSTG